MNALPIDSLVTRRVSLPRLWQDEPAQHLVKTASSADTRQALARVGLADLPGIGFPIRRGHAYLFLVTMGGGEYYACVAGETLVARPNGSHTRIELLRPGDEIMMGDGSRGKVLRTMSRDAESHLEVKAECLPYSVRMSEEHPVQVARREQFVCARDKYIRVFPDQVGKRAICRRRQSAGCTLCGHLLEGVATETAEACTLRRGDFLVAPVPTAQGPEVLSTDEARAIGYWLAEGSFQKAGYADEASGERPISHLVWTFGWHEYNTLAADCRSALRACGFRTRAYFQLDNSVTVVTATGRPSRTRTWYSWFFEHSHTKRIPDWMCTQPREARLALLKAYFDGDGTLNTVGGFAQASSVSYDLAAGIQRLLWSLGIPASCCRGKTTNKYMIHYMLSDAEGTILDYGTGSKLTGKTRSFVHNGMVYLPVRSIKRHDRKLRVHNLEVTGDHLYLTGGFVSHNCNENADLYMERDNVLVKFPEPCDPKVPEMVLGKGLVSCHKTFRKYGAVYKHHKTEPEHGVKRSGEIAWERWNPGMHRGELIVELPENGWEDELSLYEQGKPLMWSQGSGTPADWCFPEDTLIATDWGQVPIQDIREGALVRTHLGRMRRVTATMQRKWRGTMVTVSAQGLPDISSTENHPFLIIPGDDMRACQGSVGSGNKKRKRRHTFDDKGRCIVCGRTAPDPVWRGAGDLKPDDVLLTPVGHLTPGGFDDPDLAYILGAYAGDGCIVNESRNKANPAALHRDYGIQITVGLTDAHIEKLCGVLAKATGKRVARYGYADGRKAIDLNCRDRELAALCRATVGTGSRTKHARLLFSTREAALSFLGGYIDADGSWDAKKGTTRTSTVSRDLAYSVRDIALSAGLTPTLRAEARNKEYGFPTTTDTVYWLYFSSDDTEALRPYASKIGNTVPGRHFTQTSDILIKGKTRYIAMPITGVKHNHNMSGTVYNFAVAQDESYIANGAAVHNCSRCGFKFTSKTKSRCRHILLRKLCFEKDGFQNLVHCPDSIFYDISYVGNNPASKIAAALFRVASSEAAPSLAESLRLTSAFRHPSRLVLAALRKAESEVDSAEAAGVRLCLAPSPGDDAALVSAARKLPPEDALGALHRLEIILTPTQFARIFLVSAEPMGVGGFLDALPGVFGRLTGDDPMFADDAGYLPQRPPEPTAVRSLEPFAGVFSAKATMNRPLIIVHSASAERPRHPTRAGAILAGEYAKYLHTCLAMYGGPSAARRYAGIMAAGL